MTRVRTAHSDYLIDTSAHTLCRQPRETEANVLRRDGETVTLLEILTLEVGVMAEFLVQLPDVAGPTYRRTTAVETIEEDDALKARVVFTALDTSEQVELGTHMLQFGGEGDGYCYAHQTFDCFDNFTPVERAALDSDWEYPRAEEPEAR